LERASAESKPNVAAGQTRGNSPSGGWGFSGFAHPGSTAHNVLMAARGDSPLPCYPAAERAIQRLWAEGRIGSPARAASGAVVEWVEPGRWNRLGGPDFLGAELRVDGRRIRGDVEIDLRSSGWEAHGHGRDPAFRGVILHAVLLGPALPVRTCQGAAPEVVELLPLLPEDLEAAAEHDALLELRGRDAEIARLVREGNPELERDLRRRARERFAAKAAALGRRVGMDGWTATCHRSALEAMGHGGNRAPMAALGMVHDAAAFAMADPDRLYLEQTGRWRLHGVRPAGHPHRRLATYVGLCRARSDWPTRLAGWLAEAARGAATRGGLLDRVLGGVLPVSLADTLATDALLPLGGEGLAERWLDWPAGLRPDDVDAARRRLGLGGRARNWQVQGMLHTLGRGGKG
jgi:hypothetical protein